VTILTNRLTLCFSVHRPPGADTSQWIPDACCKKRPLCDLQHGNRPNNL